MDCCLLIVKVLLFVGICWVVFNVIIMFFSEEEKEKKCKKVMKEQVDYFVFEIGKFKGFIVKIG